MNKKDLSLIYERKKPSFSLEEMMVYEYLLKNIGIEDVKGDVLQLLRIRKNIKILWRCF
jgi:hypothetical protein